MVILAGLVGAALAGPAQRAVGPGSRRERTCTSNYLAIVRTLLITQLLPLALGLGIHHAAPECDRGGSSSRLASSRIVLLLALVGLIVATQYETLAAIRPRAWMGMGLLLLASLGIGWLCGGRDLATRKALAVTTATRNVAVGLVIVASNFAGTPAVTAVVAYGLISILGALGFALPLGRFTALERKDAHAGSSR